MVRGLPATATAEEVRKHFNRLYDLSRPDWTFEVPFITSYCNRTHVCCVTNDPLCVTGARVSSVVSAARVTNAAQQSPTPVDCGQ
jgi:hypothetical protein